MRHGATPRSTRRSAPEGALAQLSRQDFVAQRDPAIADDPVAVGVATVPAGRPPAGAAPASTGHHRQPSTRRRAPREPQRTLQMLMSGLGALIVFGICGLSGFFVVADERHGHAEAAERTAGTDRIQTRSVDSQPLTLQEVFPDPQIRVTPSAAPYSVGMTHIDTDCDIAATGRLGDVLSDHACSQVVRAGITAPYGDYRVTAGVFNLAEATDAAVVGEQARHLVETGGGTFAAMDSHGPDADPLAQPLAQVGWHEHGHYLVYCVISRPDGLVVTDEDSFARRITADLVESYLVEEILGRRRSGT
jgi:hypothetical protein